MLTSHSTAPSNAANFATLREIEGRLKSIRNIEKITNTMKVIASTRLTRAQKAMEESRVYGTTSNTVFESAETKPEEDKKTLFVVASSDKGLCGGIHSGLSKATRRLLEETPNADIVVLGEKAKAQLSRSNGQNIVLSFSQVCKDIPTFTDAQAIADQIALLPTNYGSIKIIHNKFINAQSYEPTTVDAYSEEAITNSRTLPLTDCFWGIVLINNKFLQQPTFPLSRLRKRLLPTCASILWPTACSGPWLRVWPVKFL